MILIRDFIRVDTLNFENQLPAILPRLRRFALTLTTSPPAADDLLQTTLDRAISRLDQCKKDTHLDRWLFTIMSSIHKNNLRALTVRHGNGVLDAENNLTSDPSKAPERTIFLHQVFNAVMELPEHQRAAILLVYVEGYRYTEAAETLAIPLGTLMSRLARARTSLAKRLSEEPPILRLVSHD